MHHFFTPRERDPQRYSRESVIIGLSAVAIDVGLVIIDKLDFATDIQNPAVGAVAILGSGLAGAGAWDLWQSHRAQRKQNGQ